MNWDGDTYNGAARGILTNGLLQSASCRKKMSFFVYEREREINFQNDILDKVNALNPALLRGNKYLNIFNLN